MLKSLVAKRAIHSAKRVTSRTILTNTCTEVEIDYDDYSTTINMNANQEYCFYSNAFMLYGANHVQIAFSSNNGTNFSAFTSNAIGATAKPLDGEDGVLLYKIKSNETQIVIYYPIPFVSADIVEDNLHTIYSTYITLKKDFEHTLTNYIDFKPDGQSIMKSTQLIFFNPNNYTITYRNGENSTLNDLDGDEFENNTVVPYGGIEVSLTYSFYNATVNQNISFKKTFSSVVTGKGVNGTLPLPNLFLELTNNTIYTYSTPDAVMADYSIVESGDSEPVLKTWHIILIAVGGVVVVVAIAILIYCLACRKKGVSNE